MSGPTWEVALSKLRVTTKPDRTLPGSAELVLIIRALFKTCLGKPIRVARACRLTQKHPGLISWSVLVKLITRTCLRLTKEGILPNLGPGHLSRDTQGLGVGKEVKEKEEVVGTRPPIPQLAL